MQAGNLWKIEGCVNEIKRLFKGKKSIPYDDLLQLASRHALYKNDIAAVKVELDKVGIVIDKD
jgi:hypothetical protein